MWVVRRRGGCDLFRTRLVGKSRQQAIYRICSCSCGLCGYSRTRPRPQCRTLRLPDRFIFRHVSCSQQAHRAFYDAIVHLPFSAHVYEAAPTPSGQPVDGFGELRRAIETIALGCPELVVANQKLYIDLERRDMRLVRQLRTSVRQALRRVGRETFANMQPCPDHRIEGGIVQIAGMLAGEYREQRGLAGPSLPRIETRITVL